MNQRQQTFASGRSQEIQSKREQSQPQDLAPAFSLLCLILQPTPEGGGCMPPQGHSSRLELRQLGELPGTTPIIHITGLTPAPPCFAPRLAPTLPAASLNTSYPLGFTCSRAPQQQMLLQPYICLSRYYFFPDNLTSKMGQNEHCCATRLLKYSPVSPSPWPV